MKHGRTLYIYGVDGGGVIAENIPNEPEPEDENHPAGPEPEIEVDFDFDIDFENMIVQSIDGVLFKSMKHDDEIRLLFYYEKPGGIDTDGKTVQIKGLAEFRMPQSTFKDVVNSFNLKMKYLGYKQKTIDDYIEPKNQPMFA